MFLLWRKLLLLPQRYKFSSKSQLKGVWFVILEVVVATTKVQIFKQITTVSVHGDELCGLLLLPQRYKFSSKSQLSPNSLLSLRSCCCYHKGTNFQANHNSIASRAAAGLVVVATTKVQIFKQITTSDCTDKKLCLLLLLPQRYKFSSKSQRTLAWGFANCGCCCYHKGTNFQANHNGYGLSLVESRVVVATTKVQIFKQITTRKDKCQFLLLLLLPQRYKFSSKSQHSEYW